MKYKCLVFDHDDTVVNSTATIHHPAFLEFLKIVRPGKTISLEDYFLKNFEPGFISMCHEEYGLTDAELDDELIFWRNYVKNHVPSAYPGIREIMLRQKQEGGILTVVSHSLSDYIYRDYEANGFPRPDMVFGWDMPEEQRKPSTYPLEQIMKTFSLQPSDLLVVDDLKPGYDMAKNAGIDFAASGWSNDIEPIAQFMKKNCGNYFKTVAELDAFLQ